MISFSPSSSVVTALRCANVAPAAGGAALAHRLAAHTLYAHGCIIHRSCISALGCANLVPAWRGFVGTPRCGTLVSDLVLAAIFTLRVCPVDLFSLYRPQLLWEQLAFMLVHEGCAAKLLHHLPARISQVFAMLSSRGWHLGDVGDAFDLLHDECAGTFLGLELRSFKFCAFVCGLPVSWLCPNAFALLDSQSSELAPFDCCIVPFAPRIREG